MTTFPDKDPAAAPRLDGHGGGEASPGYPQVPGTTSPDATALPSAEPPGVGPHPPAPADGSGAAAGILLELALS